MSIFASPSIISYLVSIYVSLYLSIYLLSVYLWTCLFICLFIYLSVYIYLLIYLSGSLFICLSTYLPIYLLMFDLYLLYICNYLPTVALSLERKTCFFPAKHWTSLSKIHCFTVTKFQVSAKNMSSVVISKFIGSIRKELWVHFIREETHVHKRNNPWLWIISLKSWDGKPNDSTLWSYHYSICYYIFPKAKPFNFHLQCRYQERNPHASFLLEVPVCQDASPMAGVACQHGSGNSSHVSSLPEAQGRPRPFTLRWCWSASSWRRVHGAWDTADLSRLGPGIQTLGHSNEMLTPYLFLLQRVT